jgi:hypothetical protein
MADTSITTISVVDVAKDNAIPIAFVLPVRVLLHIVMFPCGASHGSHYRGAAQAIPCAGSK